MSTVIAEQLFRRQAIKHLSERPLGRPICRTPRSWWWLTSLVTITFTAALVFASHAEYSRHESVRGWLVSKQGVVRIAHNVMATVTRVVRKPGDLVVKGDPLMYLSLDSTLSSGSSKSDELLEQLRAVLPELDLQESLLREQQTLDSVGLSEQLSAVESERMLLLEERAEQRQRVAMETEKLKKLQGLVRGGAISEWDVLRQQEVLLTARQALNRLAQNDARLLRERRQLESRLQRLPLQTAASVSALRSERTRLSQEIAEHESRRLIVLTAPIDGTVASVEAREGNTTATQKALMTLLPSDSQLAADVYVPSKAVGFIRAGQSVQLNYDAFPRQKFGVFDGEVEHVSEYVLLPSEIPQTFPVREATYRVRVQIRDTAVNTRGGTTSLRPGMLLAADVVLERRNLLEWLLEPLRSRRREST